MVEMNWKEHISFNPEVCHGKAHIKGTRVIVSVILDCLSEGMNEKEILENYPSLKEEHISAVIHYSTIK